MGNKAACEQTLRVSAYICRQWTFVQSQLLNARMLSNYILCGLFEFWTCGSHPSYALTLLANVV